MLKQIKLLRSGIQTVKDNRINEERKHKCFLIKLRICTARRDYPTGNAADILKYQDRTKGNKYCTYRSDGKWINVNELLKPFGGGGHISAAGLKYQTDNVEELKKQILDRVAEMKNKQ